MFWFWNSPSTLMFGCKPTMGDLPPTYRDFKRNIMVDHGIWGYHGLPYSQTNPHVGRLCKDTAEVVWMVAAALCKVFLQTKDPR